MQHAKTKLIFAENKYGAYFIPDGTEHRLASAAILRGDVWEPETIEFIRQHGGKGDIIHAGTFFGDFLPALSSSLSDQNYIWAFEPNHENFFCAHLTQRINQLTNVRLYNCGLGAHVCKLPQKQFDSRKNLKIGGGSKIYSMIPEGKREQDFTQVSVLPGADVIGERYVSLIHLDVEGFESQALLGLLPVITQHHPILILETVPSDEFMQHHLFSLGYKFSQRLDHNSVFCLDAL